MAEVQDGNFLKLPSFTPLQDAKAKAAELEDFGSAPDKEEEEGGAPAEKRPKTQREEGEQYMLRFLEEVRAAKVTEMTPEKALDTVGRLKGQLLAHKNAFVAEALGLAEA